MDLKEIRKEIDATDDEILRLFLKRMDLCVGVAKYKKENNMQVFQGKREQEILERIKSESPDDLGGGRRSAFHLYNGYIEMLTAENIVRRTSAAF